MEKLYHIWKLLMSRLKICQFQIGVHDVASCYATLFSESGYIQVGAANNIAIYNYCQRMAMEMVTWLMVDEIGNNKNYV